MQSLRAQLMRFPESGAAQPDCIDLEAWPMILLAPNSHLGKLFASGVAARLPNAVAVPNEPLRFFETGSESSHVSDPGDISVNAARLDDELDRMTFLKMDIEGFESRALERGAGLIARHRPRKAIAAYHYATDMLDIVNTIDRLAGGYHIRLRQHFNYHYDSIIYAAPMRGWESA